jgi:hypothetical protein
MLTLDSVKMNFKKLKKLWIAIGNTEIPVQRRHSNDYFLKTNQELFFNLQVLRNLFLLNGFNTNFKYLDLIMILLVHTGTQYPDLGTIFISHARAANRK